MKIRHFFLLFLLSALLAGCKQKLDVAGPYVETPVIYGLLNQYADTQYIKIEKGFLLQGNAYLAAGIPDSIYYPDILTVELLGSGGAVYKLKRMLFVTKDTGIFARSPNYVYFYKGYYPIDSTQSYTLYDSNTVSQKVVTAQASLCSHFNVDFPRPGSTIHLSNSSPQLISWNNNNSNSVYDLSIRFFYYEYSSSSNQVVKDTFIDIPIFTSISPTSGQTTQQWQISENQVLGYLSQNLQLNNSNIYRQFNMTKGMQFKFAAGGSALDSFFISQQAQNGLASSDALPPYTNIKGGVGLFSSRYYEEVDSVEFVPSSLDSLSCGSFSAGLRFNNPLNGNHCY